MKTGEHHFAENPSPGAPPSALRRRLWSGMAIPWHATAAADPVSKAPRPAPAAAEKLTADCRCSPRDMAELSLDLFLAGVLTDEEYALLAFQPELHPDFDRTIGALTGERAKPDQSRDYVAIWRERLEFERGRCRPDRDLIERIQRILLVLRRLGTSGGFGMANR
jgi:hypothetical protein